MSDLLSRAIQIKSETTPKANTATRVGSLFQDVVTELENITGSTIFSLETEISGNSSNIENLNSDITSLESEIDLLEEDLSGTTTSLETEINVNVNDINLLSGITENIIEKINIKNVTYSELVTLIDSSGLTEGQQYRITDYQTVHYMTGAGGTILLDELSNPYIHTGNLEPLIVKAFNSNKLHTEAYSDLHSDDILHYDWDPSNWINDNSFASVPGFKGVIFFRHNLTCDVYAPFDWRNFMFRRWKFNYPQYDPSIAYVEKDIVQDSAGAYRSFMGNEFTDDNLGNDTDYYNYWCKFISYDITPYLCSHENMAADIYDYVDMHMFYRVGYDIDFVNNNLKEFVNCVHLDSNINWDLPSWNYNRETIALNSVFILNSEDGWNKSYVKDIKAKPDFCNNTLIGGQESNSFGSGFYNNTIGDGAYGNTFGNGCDSNFFDYSVSYNTIGDDCYDLYIAGSFWYNELDDDVKSIMVGDNSWYNKFKSSFGMNIGWNAWYNEFGFDNHNIVLGDNCWHMKFGNFLDRYPFGRSYFGANCWHSKIGDYSLATKILGQIWYTEFAGYNYGNTIAEGSMIWSCRIGYESSYNTFNGAMEHCNIGNDSNRNTFGDECFHNEIGNGVTYCNFNDYFQGNTVGNKVSYINTHGTLATPFRNNEFKNGVGGTSVTPLDFTGGTHTLATYNTEIFRRPDGTNRLRYIDNTDTLVITDHNE